MAKLFNYLYKIYLPSVLALMGEPYHSQDLYVYEYAHNYKKRNEYKMNRLSGEFSTGTANRVSEK